METAVDDSRLALQHELIYDELSALLAEANDCMHKEPKSQVHQHLQRAGFKKLPQLYKSVYNDLKVFESMQSLEFPVELQGENSATEDGKLPEYAGSKDNLAGISESTLIAANQSGLSFRQAWHSDLVPELEARIADRCRWLCKILEATGGMDSLVEEVDFQVATLDASQHQSLSSLLGVVEDVKCYLTLLSDFLDQQAAFVSTHKLTSQRDIDLKESSALRASCRAQVLKVKVIEKRLLSFTYTDQTIPALKAVSSHLHTAELEAEDTFQQLSARLRQFEELGPEFLSLAERYQDLLEDLRHAEYTLQELQQAANVSAESP